MIALKSQPTSQHSDRFLQTVLEALELERTLGTAIVQPRRSRAKKAQRPDNPSPPAHPLDAPEMRLLMAFLEESANPTGKYDTVLAEEQDRLAGRVGLAQYLPASVSAEDRSSFALGGIVPRVIGAWGGPGDFTPGLADLTEQECRTTELALAGFTAVQIAQLLDRKKRRNMFGSAALSVETTERYIARSHAKLRSLFGLEDLDSRTVES